MTALAAEQLIAQQLHNLQQLEELLSVEKEVLQKQSPQALTAVTEQKEALLKTIQQLDEQNAQNVVLKNEVKSGIHQHKIAEIEAILLRCKDKNQVNGQIIQQSSLAAERMKNSLLENHNRSSMTYNSKGKKSGGLSSLGIKA
ncbi:flagellar export chaperone FlgN [Colwellia hornerae]|uniref:Flagellar protein FlgN n=1 Tax=Colwellia hornerae TaxID=89402 RepID=A0A5C6Q457_9GAMM|nr:flagellar export chaperone FlgN [Colwellia hornerae]TWX54151.1 flagellar protein FlgN [Colwellia hornerae]TWX60926.1 flagellar protein FlgN [Colwellia hornerae]TWX63663.1 flagellar protein FlgN [Colwellia hornerae]